MGTALCITTASSRLDGLAARLELAGVRAVVAEGTVQGLATLRRAGADIVICDAGVSGVDGCGLLADLRDMPPPLAALPVVLVVDDGDTGARRRYVGLGADDVVPRSAGAEELAAVVSARLGRSLAVRNILQQCNPADCPARYQAEQSAFNATEPVPGLLSLAQLDGLLSCETLWAHDRPPVVMVIGIDRFAAIAASLGTEAGEELVRLLGHRLQSLEPSLGLIAHVGRDAFAILLPRGIALSEAEGVGESLRRQLARPFDVDGRDLSITVSIGLAAGRGAVGLPVLLAEATAAAHRANTLGGNLVLVFQAEAATRQAERPSTAAALRSALDRGEFRLAYQPVVRLSDGEVVGAEALLRWSNPDMGTVPPAVLVPVAEDCGLIGDIGDVVLRQAARTLAQWMAEPWGAAMTMAVSVSPHQLRREGFAAQVKDTLSRAGVPASALVVGITEGAFVHGERTVTDCLAELKRLGLGLSMDDFGPDYSLLSNLHRIPLDQIKIDRSFVRGLPQSASGCGLVEAVMAIAGRLGLGVVAAGVETEGQAAFLKARGVDFAQGTLLGPPMAEEEFRALAANPRGDGPGLGGPARPHLAQLEAR